MKTGSMLILSLALVAAPVTSLHADCLPKYESQIRGLSKNLALEKVLMRQAGQKFERMKADRLDSKEYLDAVEADLENGKRALAQEQDRLNDLIFAASLVREAEGPEAARIITDRLFQGGVAEYRSLPRYAKSRHQSEQGFELSVRRYDKSNELCRGDSLIGAEVLISGLLGRADKPDLVYRQLAQAHGNISKDLIVGPFSAPESATQASSNPAMVGTRKDVPVEMGVPAAPASAEDAVRSIAAGAEVLQPASQQ